MPDNISLCSIGNCRNSDRSKIGSTVFYFIPTDPVQRRRWTEALKKHICGLPVDLSKIAICIDHFTPDAFIKGSIKLKHGSVPSKFPLSSQQRGLASGSAMRLVKCNKTKADPQNSEMAFPPSFLHVKLETGPVDDQAVPNEVLTDPLHLEQTNIGTDGTHPLKYEAFFLNRIKQLHKLKETLTEERETLIAQQTDVEAELKDARDEWQRKMALRKTPPKEEEEILKKCFSTCQMRLLYGQLKSRWSLDDLAMAYTITSLCSKDVYVHLRKNLKYPLPGVSNISRCYKSKCRKKSENSE